MLFLCTDTENNKRLLLTENLKLSLPESFARSRRDLPPAVKISRHAFLQGREEEEEEAS